MLFSWLRRRRRKKLLATPFPSEWLSLLERNMPHYETLTEDEQARLRDILRIIVTEKEWEGCGGLRMSDEIKVTIAAYAALMLIGLTDHYFDRVISILVYPDTYVLRGPVGEGGVLVGDTTLAGEAHYRGPVVLSWAEVIDDARSPEYGRNVVIHEFAHQLDMLNGYIDGTPDLEDQQQFERWKKVLTPEYQKLVRAVRHGEPTLIDGYGAENVAEFFAVTSECFFMLPSRMQHEHTKMYEAFRDYYKQDPASRPTPWNE